MKIVVAMDSFKESLGASDACDAVARGISGLRSDVDIDMFPMADGGEGTAAAMIKACGGEWISKEATGPLPDMRAEAGFAWLAAERTALVEMACASGLELLGREERNPALTTTYGTGELIAAAAEYGAKKVYLAVGGSATVDGGTGAAAALGWSFRDDRSEEVPLGGGQLVRISRIIPPAAGLGVEVEVLCDVDNPLCGPAGAAYVYGPQKGADEEMVEELEAGIENLAGVVQEQLGIDIASIPGGGAAGGLAAGAIAFMGARLISGIEFIISHTNIEEALADADWLITGEGRFDSQSLSGKVISGLVRAAQKSGTKVAVIAGEVSGELDDYAQAGIAYLTACRKEGMTRSYSMENAALLIEKAARRLAAKLM